LTSKSSNWRDIVDADKEVNKHDLVYPFTTVLGKKKSITFFFLILNICVCVIFFLLFRYK